MRTSSSIALATVLALSFPWAVHAQEPSSARQTFRVDDSGTVVLDPSLEMQWQSVGRVSASNIVSASTRVSVQLNLSLWLGLSGRIFMNLPRTSGPTVRASWTTGGILHPGTLISGDRALVYSGPISSAVLRDVLDIELEADGARLNEPEALTFGFEIEIDQ